MTKTEAKWAERVREWRESGAGAKEFAAGRGYEASTLRWWASELQHRTKRGAGQARGQGLGSGPTMELARVVPRGRPRRATAAVSSAGGVVMEISGARIVIARGFDAELLSDVVRVLGGAR